jgi:sodium transport system ATP-binding protein
LDVLASRGIVNFIRNCRMAGKTVLFSSHIMSEVEKLCDRIAIIHRGKIMAEGTLPELQQMSGETDLEEIFIRIVEGRE